MKEPTMLMTGATGKTRREVAGERFAIAAAKNHGLSSAQPWFARGERVGYDSNARCYRET